MRLTKDKKFYIKGEDDMEIKAKNQISIVDVSDGKSVSSIVPEYYLSTSNIELSGGSWSTEIPARTKDTYIWTRSRVEFSNPTETTYTTAVLDNTTNNMVAVGSVTETLNAELDVEGNTLIAKAGKLVIQSPQLSLDEEGNLDIDTNGLKLNRSGDSEFSGNVKASSGEFTKGFSVNVPIYKAVSDGEPLLVGYADMKINEDGLVNAYEAVDTAGETDDTAFISVYDCAVSLYAHNVIKSFSLGITDIGSRKKLNLWTDEILTIKGSKICIDGPDLLNPIDMSSYTETNITNRSIIASGSGNIITHKRYNSVTVTCTVSSVLYELATSAGYVSIGTLPTDCIPTYKIIEYHRFSALYFGQIQITTDGKISIGYVKKNDGSAVNLPANSGMYWAFTYTI